MNKELRVTIMETTDADLNIALVRLAESIFANAFFPVIDHMLRILVRALAHLQRLQIAEQMLSLPSQQILIEANGRGWNQDDHAQPNNHPREHPDHLSCPLHTP
jgi:hypothetical protein